MNYEENKILKGFALKHRKRTSIQHWQLRDLIHESTNDGEVFCLFQNNISTYNFKYQKTKSICSLDFQPVSFAVSGNYLAAGGQECQLFVQDLSTQKIIQNAYTGSSINNGCLISEKEIDSKLFVSNNDCKIRIFSLPTMDSIHELDVEVPVNYTCISSDSRFLCAASDSNYLSIFDGRNSYKQITKLKDFKDGCFSCCFDPTDTYLAATSQDGSTSIFDVRTMKKLKKFQSKQNQLKGSCRAVKFSKTAGIDLMVFAEHCSYFHVIDTRNFNDEQIIRVQEGDKNITGMHL
eukprot:gene4300-7656_t